VRRSAAAPTLACALLAACGGEETKRPAPAPQPAGGLRPLTSRDEGAARPMPPAGAATLPPGHPPTAGEDASGVSGTIAISPALRARQAPTDTLFIVARSAGGGQVVAVRKEEDARLPRPFRLSPADVMVSGTPFVGPFDITARLSKSGDALPATGDLEGAARGVAAGARDVVITVDRVRP
jgi:cytochrome c-type biogenesis protein CcmH